MAVGLESLNTDATESVFGVKVLTWGSSPDAGNGLVHALDALLFGGNVGHAAVQITFPDNPNGQELLKYCQEHNIPCREKTVSIFDKQGLEKEIKVIEAYWSWWPSYAGTFYLRKDRQEDVSHEREGVSFEWDEEKIKKLNLSQPEQRHHKGKLGSRLMSYAPDEIIHVRDLGDEQVNYLQAKRQYDVLKNEVRDESSSITIFETKLNARKSELERVSTIKLSPTEKIILNKFSPDWKKQIADPDKVNKEDLIILENIKNTYKAKIISQYNWMQYGATMTVLNTLKEHLNDNRFPVTNEFRWFLQMLQYEGENDIELYDEVLNAKELTSMNIIEIYEACNRRLEGVMEQDKGLSDSVKAQRLEKLLSILKNLQVSLSNKPEGEKNINVNDSLAALLNDLNPFLKDRNNDWKNIVDAPVDKLTLEKINNIYQVAQQSYERVKQDIIPMRYDLVGIQSLVDQEISYTVRGLEPSGVVFLPIRPTEVGPLTEDTIGAWNGLDVKAMLEKMVELSDKDAENFDLYRKNCSKSTDAILEAGAVEEYQKRFFKQKALGYFGNPQMCYNNALEFQDAFYKRNKGYRFNNPIEKAGGAIVDTLANPKASGLKKTGAALAAVIVFPVAFVVFSVRKILNPLESIKGAAGLINFAFSRNSNGLKALAVITLAPVIVVLSPFAAVQYGIKSAIVAKTSNKKYARLENKIKEEQLNTLSDEEKQQSIDAEIEQRDQDQSLKAVMDNLTIEIDPRPEEAIAKFSEALNRNLIPMLSKKSEAKVTQYMNLHPEEKSTFDKLLMQRAKKMSEAVKYFKEQWKNDKIPTKNEPQTPILEQHDQEVLDILEKAAHVLEVEKQKSSGVLTRLEHERERTQLANQLVQETKMFINLQQALFNTTMAFGKNLIQNAKSLDKQGNLSVVQRETLGAISNILLQELPFMQMDNAENVKKGFVLFVNSLQTLNQFSKENPELMQKMSGETQVQLEAMQNFIINAKAMLVSAGVNEKLREGLLGRFTQLEEHVEKITKQLKPLDPIQEANLKAAPAMVVEKHFNDLIFPIGEALLKTNLVCRENNVPASEQAEFEKLGQDIMRLPFELLTERKNEVQSIEALGNAFEAMGSFLKHNSELAVNIGSTFCHALKPVFDFVKNNDNPLENKEALDALAIKAQALQQIFENQARMVIQQHPLS